LLDRMKARHRDSIEKFQDEIDMKSEFKKSSKKYNTKVK